MSDIQFAQLYLLDETSAGTFWVSSIPFTPKTTGREMRFLPVELSIPLLNYQNFSYRPIEYWLLTTVEIKSQEIFQPWRSVTYKTDPNLWSMESTSSETKETWTTGEITKRTVEI